MGYKMEAGGESGGPYRKALVHLVPGTQEEIPVYRRESLRPGFTATGPAIIEETDSTSFIEQEHTFEMDDFGVLRIHLK
jgi:N-methylhydantoinase A/oxoprolinase/acetone carboxylase beta subunit